MTVTDKKRVAKRLLATHPIGRQPVLQLHLNEHEEAAFIATEIKHLVAATGGMLEWGDFVVLRKSKRITSASMYSAMSAMLSSTLQRPITPHRERTAEGGHPEQDPRRTQVLRATRGSYTLTSRRRLS